MPTNVLMQRINYGSKHSASQKPSLGYSDVQRRYRSRKWTSSNGFRKSRKNAPKGHIFLPPMNSYEDYQFTREMGQGTLLLRELGVYYQEVWGVFNAPNITNPVLPLPGHTAMLTSCIQESSKQANGNSFSVPIFMAEFSKTKAMFGKAAVDISKTISRRKIKDRSVADSWLEYRYGWRLVVKDLYDALVKIHDFRTRGIVTHSRVSRRQQSSTSWVAPDAGIPRYCNSTSIFGMDYNMTQTDTLTTNLILNWTSTPSGEFLGNLQTLGITNPAALVWELTPFSFVIDWFISVGDYLSTLDAFIGKSFKTGCISYVLARETTAKARNVTGRNGFTVVSKSVPTNTTYERFYKRVPLSSFPSAEPPRFDVNLSAPRIVDAVTLMRQALR